ncbi:MAG: glycerol-3-phosphate acyltransferase [Anaerolineae bacterium]|nr:glycerol-3-phosphate acyltransferase [Anaerolineae bacterium]
MALVSILVSLVLGYLLGSIPTGLLVVRQFWGVDIRTVGSGRTGGTNAMRAAGRKAFLLVGFLDGLKCFLAVIVARLVFPDIPLAAAFAGIGGIAGNIWSMFIGFKGGAGGASNIGIMIALQPLVGIFALLLGGVAFFTIRMASVATLTGCTTAMLTLFALAGLGYVPWEYTVYGVVQLILVVIALRPNIQRIMNGTERRISLRGSGSEATDKSGVRS